MLPEVELQYIPRSFSIEPRIRVTIFRDQGSAILDIQNSVIAEFCRPENDGREDSLRAFRESVPFLLKALNQVIAATPPGGVVHVTADMLRPSRTAA
jgi:hypothetical protein